MKTIGTLKIILVMTLILTHFELMSFQTPDSVWESLQSGNKRFVRDRGFTRQRAKVGHGQNPPCIVLSCSDSRVPPELVFNKGIGKLFVARVAGQVAVDAAIDSVEYAVSHYDSAAVVVLGHTHCGAVKGALKRLQENNGKIDVAHGHLNAILIPIEIAILEAGINIYGPNALEESVRANISYVAHQLVSKSHTIAKALEMGRINIVGAEYSLHTGKVEQLFIIK